MSDLSPEDAKLVTLAKAARARIRAREGAAIRDDTGRTYAAANVARGDFSLSALQNAVAQALSAGATSLEAVVLLNDEPRPNQTDSGLLAEFADVTVYHGSDAESVVVV